MLTTICLKELESQSKARAKLELDIAQYQEAVGRLRSIAALIAAGPREDTGTMSVFIHLLVVKQRIERNCALLEQRLEGVREEKINRNVVAREMLYPNTSIEIDSVFYKSTAVQYACMVSRVRNQITLRSGHYA